MKVQLAQNVGNLKSRKYLQFTKWYQIEIVVCMYVTYVYIYPVFHLKLPFRIHTREAARYRRTPLGVVRRTCAYVFGIALHIGLSPLFSVVSLCVFTGRGYNANYFLHQRHPCETRGCVKCFGPQV